MTKTCQTCRHSGEYLCSHPDGHFRPTYSNNKGGEILTYSPACDLYEKAETPATDQPSSIPRPEYDYAVITMLAPKDDPDQLKDAGMRFKEDIANALNDDWHCNDFTACFDGEQVLMIQTMIKQIS